MVTRSRLLLTPDQRGELVDAAAGRTVVDLALVGGQVLNVFTGRLAPATIGMPGVALTGRGMVETRTGDVVTAPRPLGAVPAGRSPS